MIIAVIALIAVVSILWSLWSLRGILKNAGVSKGVKKELSHSRVIFHKGQSTSGFSSSSAEKSSVSDL